MCFSAPKRRRRPALEAGAEDRRGCNLPVCRPSRCAGHHKKFVWLLPSIEVECGPALHLADIRRRANVAIDPERTWLLAHLGCPVCTRKQPNCGHRWMSETCHDQTHASRQTRSIRNLVGMQLTIPA